MDITWFQIMLPSWIPLVLKWIPMVMVFLWLDVDISWITLASSGSYGLFMALHGSSMDYNAPGITLPGFNDSKLVSHGNVMDHYVFRWLNHGLWNVSVVF